MTQPSLGGIARSNPYSELVRRLKRIEQRLNQQVTARSLGYATFPSGGSMIISGILTVIDSAARTLATIGSDVNGTGLRTFRAGGAAMFESMGSGYAGLSYTVLRDVNGNAVIQDDPSAGLAHPYHAMGPMVDYLAPTATTTSGTYTTLQTGLCTRWNPCAYAVFLVSSSAAGTTGNVQLVDAANNVIGSPIPVPENGQQVVTLGAVGTSTGSVPWPAGTWTPGDTQMLSVQAQRTAGTGTIGVRTLGLLAVASF